MAQKGLALARGHRAPAPALKQAHGQQVFQFFQRLGDGRLRDGQHVGRLLQAAVLRHRQEALQMPEFDAFIDHLAI
jgi:hypothetical protein